MYVQIQGRSTNQGPEAVPRVCPDNSYRLLPIISQFAIVQYIIMLSGDRDACVHIRGSVWTSAYTWEPNMMPT